MTWRLSWSVLLLIGAIVLAFGSQSLSGLLAAVLLAAGSCLLAP